MRILAIEELPLHWVSYQFAGPDGRARQGAIPILRGQVDRLPGGLQALVCTSDLQGIELPSEGAPPRLIGERVAEELVALSEMEMLPAPEQSGVLLAGDFYSHPEARSRGATGPVDSVWSAFAQAFRWVVGVLGNHDTADNLQSSTVQPTPVALLDGASCERDGLVIAGLSGIVGSSSKLNRRDPGAYTQALARLLRANPDLLLIHESPAAHHPDQGGSFVVRDALALQPPALVICGHHHWSSPLATMRAGYQVLNVDARVVVLVTA